MPRKKQPAETPVTDNTPEEQILKTEYSELMQKSYIDYAMSVIIARALPDVRDGLKPVQRRTLYDMRELSIHWDGAYRKSARIVGDTMGKYHPHGDSSIYDCLVVMAQDFKKTLPLVDGHGNFGTIEGDTAAAMRYTEARLQRITEEALLADLDKNVVDFQPNFDETETEPTVLPCKIPNFLINGSEGIAVGMATSAPTHNVSEAIDAEIAYLQNPDISVRELMRYLPGPDFPTGGIIVNANDLEEIYATGQGKLRIRGKTEVEKGRNGHLNLVVTEIPYTMIGSGISKFLSDVAALSENRLTNDIVDISNQSSKEGIRIVIELRKDTNVEAFENLLFSKTRLEDTFGVNMLAICEGRPKTLGLKEILKANVDFAFEITRRKYETLLEKEKAKREIQEGLIRACSVIDLIIEILRGSKDRPMAKRCLVEGNTDGIRFKTRESEVMASQLQFTEKQADAILDMRLYKLIGLELDALIKEHEDTVANIYRYEDILEKRSSMTQVIRQELSGFKKAYAAPRKTVITQEETRVYTAPAKEEVDTVFVMDDHGYAKLIDMASYERNRETVETEFPYHFIVKSTGRVCIFTDRGNLHTIKTELLPLGKPRDKGVPIDNVSGFDSTKERVILATSQSSLNLYRIAFVTKFGNVKQVDGGEFDVTRKQVSATVLEEGDEVILVEPIQDASMIVMATKNGYFLKFMLSEIPMQKKTAKGVRGIKLTQGDWVDAAWLYGLGSKDPVEYNGRQVSLGSLRIAGRAGRGSKK